MADQIKKLTAGHSIEVLDAIMTEVEEARGEYESLDARLDEISGEGYSKAEVDALLALKQNALNSAQLAAVNSGIDSAKVAQIETNKNNTLKDEAALVELVDSGAKNQLSITATSSNIYTVNADGTVVVNSDSALASNSQKVIYDGAPPTSVDNKFVFSGCPSGGSTTTYRLFLQDVSSGTAVTMVALTGEDSYKNYLADFTGITAIRVSIVTYSGYKPVNIKFYPMLCTKAAWGISQTYQPHRPSYQELYEMVKALQAAT